MRNELFATLAGQESYLLQEEILQGKFGRSGDAFMTTRALAQLRHVSVVTAHNILTELCSAGYLELRGKKYFLSYAPLLEARREQKNLIGLVLPQVNNEFYSSLAEAVISISRQNGYEVIMVSTSYSSAEEKKVMKLLLNLSPSGIVSCVPTSKDSESLYRDCPIPLVLLGHSLDKSKISSVQVNSFSISRKAAQHLIEEGYKKFLYVGTKILPLENDIRYTAFQMELKQHGCALETVQISTDMKADDAALLQALKAQTEPVGVFCYHDLIAAQIYRICNKLGKRIPGDVGVVGFDDLSIASSLYPSLTTVQYRISTMADMAVSLLLASIRSPDAPYDNYYIEPNLVIRKSSVLSAYSKD